MGWFTRPNTAGGYATVVMGVVLALIGLALTLGGMRLLLLGGSLYYFLAGIGLLASGILLIGQRALGAWLYLFVVLATIAWALWEVGLNGWALVPRVVAPLVLLVPVMLTLLSTKREGAGRTVAIGIGGAAVIGIALFVTAGLSSNGLPNGVVPDSPSFAVGDPATESTGADWPVWGGTNSAQRFSPITQITPQNVRNLKVAWTYRTGDNQKAFGAETTPIKIGDSLYLCSALNRIISLDARTGKEKWSYDPGVTADYVPYTAGCRGVTYFAKPGAVAGEQCAARIIEGTLDMRLIAVDATTGRPCTDFGNNGQVDFKPTLWEGEFIPGSASITSPPVIVQGVVVTGHQVLDGQRRWAPSGAIHGVDAVTGELRFVWDMMSPETTKEPANGSHYTLGTPNSWTVAAGDEALGLVFLPMGNSGADYYSSLRRPAEDAYSTSLVALDVQTGKPRWHFQTVRNDVWDYDLGTQPTLFDMPTANGMVPAILLSSKHGEIYVLDRRTGQSLHPVEARAAPQGGVEPDQRAKTQPFSTFATLRKPDMTERDMWGMSPLDQLYCRIQFRAADYRGIYTPPTADRHWIEYPGYNGGSDWGGLAIDPVKGVIVANYNDTPNYNRLIPRAKADAAGLFPIGDPRRKGGSAEGPGPQEGVPYAVDVNAGWRVPLTGILCKQPPYGWIRAMDLRTGKTIWDRPFGSAERNGPFGIPSMLPITIGTPNNGGSVITASGLVFIAATTDDFLRAIDIRTGKELWKVHLPAGGQANPMIYEAGGKAYLVIMAGGHHFMETPQGDYFIAYALPD